MKTLFKSLFINPADNLCMAMRKTIFHFLRKKKALILRRLLLNLNKNTNDRYSCIPVMDANPWLITGASVTGNGHRKEGELCQDAHYAQVWKNGWGVAIVSDGAGTASKSHLTSALLVKKAAENAQGLVERMGWAEENVLPTREQWAHHAISFMHSMQKSVFSFAGLHAIDRADLHATLIVVIFSPIGLLVTHIGDGRAGCRDKQGNYHSLITPWEGEQAGQTVFITTDPVHFNKIVGISMFDKPADAFFILTDGCENVAWQTLNKNTETGVFEKKNKPFQPFWEQTIRTIRNMHKTLSSEQTGRNWYNYLHGGHKAFVIETDDKTMVTGIFTENQNHPHAH